MANNKNKEDVVSILRIGPLPIEPTERLLQAIEQHFSAEDAVGSHELHLDNKYFTATVRLLDIEHSLRDTDTSTILRDDGSILVFDASSAAAFDGVAALHGLHSTTLGDIVRLCVGVTTDTATNDDETEYARRVLWCLDHGYEYVPADLSAAGVAQGHDVRDKEGFARIVEALEGTVWSSAVVKSKQGQKVVQTFQSSAAQHDDAADAAESHANEYIPPPMTPIVPSPEDSEREKLAREALLPTTEGDDADAAAAPGEDEEHPTDNNDEQAIHVMEHTLQEAKRIRESSRSGELSDDARQQRAGDAAALLMNLMGQMGMDDDDDESSCDDK